MAKIFEDLHSPEWWFTVVFAATVVTLLAPLIPNLFVALFTKVTISNRTANILLRLHGVLTAVALFVYVNEMFICVRLLNGELPRGFFLLTLVFIAIPATGILYDMFYKERPTNFIVATLLAFVTNYIVLGGFPIVFVGWFIRYGAFSCISWIVMRIMWWCTEDLRRRLLAKAAGKNNSPPAS